LLFDGDRVLAIRARVAGFVTGANALVRIDATADRVLGATPLPSGDLVEAFGAGSLCVARANGSTLERIDPKSGRAASRLGVCVGTALAFAAGQLWSADRDGTLGRLPVPCGAAIRR
jgi:hypothetical protein